MARYLQWPCDTALPIADLHKPSAQLLNVKSQTTLSPTLQHDKFPRDGIRPYILQRETQTNSSQQLQPPLPPHTQRLTHLGALHHLGGVGTSLASQWLACYRLVQAACCRDLPHSCKVPLLMVKKLCCQEQLASMHVRLQH